MLMIMVPSAPTGTDRGTWWEAFLVRCQHQGGGPKFVFLHADVQGLGLKINTGRRSPAAKAGF